MGIVGTMRELRTLTLDGPDEWNAYVGEDWFEYWQEDWCEAQEELRAVCSAGGRAPPVVLLV